MPQTNGRRGEQSTDNSAECDHRLTAPTEETASTHEAIADELSGALSRFDRIDFNALTVPELRELLDARETIEETCLRHRRQQNESARVSPREVRAADA